MAKFNATATVTEEMLLQPQVQTEVKDDDAIDTTVDIPSEFTKSKWAWKKDPERYKNGGYTQAEIDALFDIPVTKLNKHYIAPQDVHSFIDGSKAKVEDYFPQNYYLSNTAICKDLVIGMPYTVRLLSVNEATNTTVCEEINTGTGVIVPYKDITDTLGDEDDVVIESMFSVVITSQRNNVYMASKKQAQPIVDREDLLYFMKVNRGFKVKVIENIPNGGFWALYNNTTRVFLPGASAAANKIYDYAGYVGKEIDVMVDNYDTIRRNFVVSAKKYCEVMLEHRVGELKFNKTYTGIVTADANDKGIFVEVDGFFTGKIEKDDFVDYDAIKGQVKRGQELDVYVRDVQLNHTNTKGQKGTRITFTVNQGKIGIIHRYCQNIIENYMNVELPFDYDAEKGLVHVYNADNQHIFSMGHSQDVVEGKTKVKFTEMNAALGTCDCTFS